MHLRPIKSWEASDKVINSDCVNKIIPLCSRGARPSHSLPPVEEQSQNTQHNTVWALINVQPGSRVTCEKKKKERKSCSFWMHCRELIPLCSPCTAQEIKDTWSVVIWNLAGGGTVWPRSIPLLYTSWSLFFRTGKDISTARNIYDRISSWALHLFPQPNSGV